jgi:N,N'-diacetyllegionaminate synthase
MPSIEIEGKLIGPGKKCFIIAEVGQVHCGNFKRACDYITAASKAGADAVKFQTHLLIALFVVLCCI